MVKKVLIKKPLKDNQSFTPKNGGSDFLGMEPRSDSRCGRASGERRKISGDYRLGTRTLAGTSAPWNTKMEINTRTERRETLVWKPRWIGVGRDTTVNCK